MDELLDAVRKRHGLRSDRALARMLGINQATVNVWRLGKSLPSDENIHMLAISAGEDVRYWLMWLNSQRATGKAREVYGRLALEMSA